jgi:hypothetical protein
VTESGTGSATDGSPAEPAVESRLSALAAAFGDLLDQEFSPSAGHVAALLNGCAFAPSLLTFWAVNGVLDFSTAFVLGTTGGPGGLAVRVLAYVLLVPVFVALRVGYYLAHPVHRKTVLSGSCPRAELLSLDWFSVGILATGLPLALQNLGPWLSTNLVFLAGIFVLPRALPRRLRLPSRVTSIAFGSGLFLFANYGTLVGLDPTVLGPVATFRLSDATTAVLLRVANALVTGPVLVALFALVLDRVLTREELTSIPFLRRSLPRRDPARTVLASAGLGTVFYLLVVAVATGHIVVVP